ncbi:hypothetical protein LguiA_006284 [Lonicera macranthoides]
MSDGGGESGRELDNIINYTKKKKSGSEDFVQAIAKIAVAQVCESVGFQGFQQSALDTFSDVAVRYIRDIGKTANLYANLAGRTEGNVFDIIQGLEDLGLSEGFCGASEINRCLADSGAVRDIVQYVDVSEEIPFVYSIPSFPVIKERNPPLSFRQVGEIPPAEHIPDWLPAFPNPEIYEKMPEGSQREAEIQMVDNNQQIKEVKEHRKLEHSLLNVQQRLATNGSETPPTTDPGDAAKAKRAADSNPFLVAPLQFGEKEVSSVVLPASLSHEQTVQIWADGVKHGSALETFAPAVEKVNSRESDSEESGKGALLKRGSAVKFKIGFGKKSLGKAMSLGHDGIEKTTLFENDNVKEAKKKRRAEQILKESMENTHELAQL